MKLSVSLSKSKLGTAWLVIRDPSTARYLICRRGPTCKNPGQWGFPGGGVDEGESFLAAARREGQEEIGVALTGSELHIAAIAGAGDTFWFEVFRKVRPELTEEVDAFKWVEPYKLSKYTLHKSVKDYFKNLLGGVD